MSLNKKRKLKELNEEKDYFFSDKTSEESSDDSDGNE